MIEYLKESVVWFPAFKIEENQWTDNLDFVFDKQ